MLARLRFLLSFFVLWVIFFQLARLLFLLYHSHSANEVTLRNKALSFLYGLRMDIAVASYLIAPLCLFLIISLFIPFFRKKWIYQGYHALVLFLLLLIIAADLEMFQSWGFRIDATPLKYLSSPREVWASMSHLPVFWILLLLIAVYAGIYLAWNRFLKNQLSLISNESRRIPTLLVLLVFMGLLIIPMRGGLQLSPLNQSAVYFSNQNFANILAVNAAWNFLNGISKGAPVKNPYQYMDTSDANRILKVLYQKGDSSTRVLNTNRPNIILVIWESFTKKAVDQSIHGVPITPRFRELMNEGIYFSNLYSSGDRTDKGVAAVLSGYPAMNNVSIIRFPNKSSRLNTLSSFFKDKGYGTSFFYGGETEFANIKSFLLQSRYDILTDKHAFPSGDQNSKWGAHDGVVAKKIISDLSSTKTPFFTTWLTLSSHEPFETPVEKPFRGNDHTSQFASSIHYTDAVLYDFIQSCKKQPWWNQTLVVIIADHGHSLLKPSDWIANFRIPMLWLGGALQQHGIVVDKVASQVDLATTLSRQIDPVAQLFPFSRDIFNPLSHPWAFFSFNNGFGMARPGNVFVFDNVGKQVILSEGAYTPSGIDTAKALQQTLFQDFIEK